ncbi:hypothetical protein [Alteromonas sp. KUL49]|uniref:hypothetical protein n=1 Tax=Alteromonas sp. KUL49 TaxID=2480798 RepID=UPI00102ED55B|nr:hypothetical protein [Alteromonas sp. KUL49]TAP37894.1 hypothetical protein EYS00_15460 [Alteromonas sp. KUL49]GEA12755.1 hypothetical protein KUL49_31300 [Alteromonas sp. KUL49]
MILVAGMRHSGSTALFNILRLAYESMGKKIFSDYCERIDLLSLDINDYDVVLIKIHEPRDDMVELADVVITTTRDLRDTVASAVRRGFYLLKQLNSVVEYSKYNRLLHSFWSSSSDYNFVYEKFIKDGIKEVDNILQYLDIKGGMSAEICEMVSDLPTDNYATTLLTPQHITDPERKESFSSTLQLKDIIEIERNNYAWLIDNGYELK